MTDYVLNTKSTMMDLREVLEHLRTDAEDLATPLAMFHTEYGDPEKRAKAMYYLGYMRLATQLLWALGEDDTDSSMETTISVDDI